MIRRSPTIPLDRDMTGRFLPYILAILILLASLMLVSSMMLSQSMKGWQQDLAGKITVQILPLDDRSAPLADRVQMALEILDAEPAILSAEPIGDTQMAELLRPWLGEGALPEGIPVPALIDVTLKPGSPPVKLDDRLSGIAGASVDDHGSWFGNIRQLSQVMASVAYMLVLLISGAAVLIMILLVRAAMAMHRDVVELLHLVGAPDAFIASQFQRHMIKVAGQGAALGGLASLFVVWILAMLADQLSLVPWLLLLVMPVVFLLLAAYTSRRVARRLLSELT